MNNRKKEIRILGLALLIFSLVYMTYSFIKDTNNDQSYITYGLVMTAIGLFLSSYGSKKEAEN